MPLSEFTLLVVNSFFYTFNLWCIHTWNWWRDWDGMFWWILWIFLWSKYWGYIAWILLRHQSWVNLWWNIWFLHTIDYGCTPNIYKRNQMFSSHEFYSDIMKKSVEWLHWDGGTALVSSECVKTELNMVWLMGQY